MSAIPQEVLNLIYQLPVACLMLIVVWRFLVFLKDQNKTWLETVRRRDEQYAEFQQETNEVLRGNAVLLNKVATIMDKVDQKLAREAFEREHGSLPARRM